MACSSPAALLRRRDDNAAYLKRRYHTDPAFKERMKANARRQYQKLKSDPERYARALVRARGYVKSFSKRAHGATEQLYQSLLSKQNGVCWICKGTDQKRRLSIDHDHTTGEIRGLLCRACNTALGLFKDDKAMLSRAVAYLSGGVEG